MIRKNFCKKLIITTLLILLYFILIFVICLIIPAEDKKTHFSLDRIIRSAEAISFLFIAISSVVGVWQYYISCRNAHINNEADKIQKSIELIGYYKDNILNKINAINYIYDKSGITNILNNIDKSKMMIFDEPELKILLVESKINDLKSIENNEKFLTAVIMANEIYNLKLPGDLPNNLSENSTTNSKAKKDIMMNLFKMKQAFMANFITDTLNNLEFFAMYFTHNIADESVIYQSAHQTYLKITELLYYNISKSNTGHCPKYYTNLIELYNIWKKRQTQCNESIIENQRNNIKKGSNATNI